MSKTIEEIKEEVAREFFNPKRSLLENSKFSNDNDVCVLEDSGAIDEVVKRYAQSQTQDLQEQNAELVSVMNWLIKSNSLSVYDRNKINEILTKHSHLKSNTNETDMLSK